MLLSWLVPFIASFAFFKFDEVKGRAELVVDFAVFKNTICFFSCLVFAWCFTKAVKGDYANKPRLLRLVYSFLGCNILMDLLILLPMSQMQLYTWFKQIGIMYCIYFFVLAVFVLQLKPYVHRRRVHKFVLVAQPLLCMFMRFTLANVHGDGGEEEEMTVATLWLTGGLVGASFLLAINTKFLPCSLLFTAASWLVEGILVGNVWAPYKYLEIRGLRLLGLMLALGYVGSDFQRNSNSFPPREAAVKNLVKEMNGNVDDDGEEFTKEE